MKKITSFLFSCIISTNAFCQACDSLFSSCIGTFSRNGYYFDLEAISDIRVTGISYLVQNQGTRDVSLYYRHGTYFGFEGVATNWTFLGTDSNVTPAFALSCPLPHNRINLDFSVCIPQGQRFGFYLVVSSGTGTVETHNNYTEGTVAVLDPNVRLITGKGQQGIGIFTGALMSGLTFQGSVRYSCMCATGVEEMSEKEAIVYPDPALQDIRVFSPQTPINHLEIYYSNGLKIENTVYHILSDDEAWIDVSGLAPGIYFLRLFSEKRISVHKFVKQ